MATTRDGAMPPWAPPATRRCTAVSASEVMRLRHTGWSLLNFVTSYTCGAAVSVQEPASLARPRGISGQRDLVVHDDPAIGGRVVFGHLFRGEVLRWHCGGMLNWCYWDTRRQIGEN
jgi:hypothetical protein